MSNFEKRAKKILKSLAQEYDEKKLEFEKQDGFSSSSTLRKKLRDINEKKTNQTQQREDDGTDQE